MMIMRSIATAAIAMLSIPCNAAILLPGSNGIVPDDFSLIAGTQGQQVAIQTFTGITGTFSATMRTAVYRNTLGTLDFYYQVSRLGAGTGGDDLIKTLTASVYDGFTVDAYRTALDPDGAGAFLARSGSETPLTTIGRTPDGNVLTVSFALPGQAGIAGTDTTSTYIFRTNAISFGPGFWSLQDGSSISGTSFSPVTAVPEPDVWALLLIGFGMVAGAARYRRRKTAIGFGQRQGIVCSG